MKLRKKKISLIFTVFIINICCFYNQTNAQCTLDATMDELAEVEACLDLCGCSSIIIPSSVQITLADKWDFTGRGAITITIEIGGQLTFSGNGSNRKDITMDSGSFLIIKDVNKTAGYDAIVNAGGNGQVRITIGISEYDGNSFDQIISSGGVDESGPLPVELLNFEAGTQQSQVVLTWSTASEINNDFFTIEKSKNGIDFAEIGTVTGNGTINTTSNYSFNDNSPYLGLSYYRLSQTDYDGTTEVFPIISTLFTNTTTGFSISPNPVTNPSLKLKVSGRAKDDLLELNIIDLQGKLVEKKYFKTDDYGNVETEFQLKKQLEKGAYIFELISKNRKEYLKVVGN